MNEPTKQVNTVELNTIYAVLTRMGAVESVLSLKLHITAQQQRIEELEADNSNLRALLERETMAQSLSLRTTNEHY